MSATWRPHSGCRTLPSRCRRAGVARRSFAAGSRSVAESVGAAGGAGAPEGAGVGMSHLQHQYIDRATGTLVREHLLANSVVSALYSPALEKAPLLTRLASSRYVSSLLGYLNYDNLLSSRATGMLKFLRQSGIPLGEFAGNLSEY